MGLSGCSPGVYVVCAVVSARLLGTMAPFRRFTSEEACRAYLAHRVVPDGYRCPRCRRGEDLRVAGTPPRRCLARGHECGSSPRRAITCSKLARSPAREGPGIL